MQSLHYAAGFVGILFSILQTTCALPTADPTSAPSTLVPRVLDRYVDCSDDQKQILGQGFADAATLARWTFDHPIDLGHTAYVLPCFTFQQSEKKGKKGSVSLILFLISVALRTICVQKMHTWRRIYGT